ncbi:MAG: DUF6056 family protein [bacterium]|nr:DUF6056 family protein [bacterium]
MKKSLKKEYILYFLFFLAIMCLSPISGDDWGNYLVGKQGIRHMIGNAIGMYFSWEGRFVSRLLINLLTYNKWLWNIVNSFVIVSIIYLINNICNFKNKKLTLVVPLIFLFTNLFTFSQVIVWIAGNITYLFVILLLLYYISEVYKQSEFSSKKTILLLSLNIIIPMFVEHMAIILILINIIFIIINYLKDKKINKKLIIFLIISIISFLCMFLSPGNSLRSSMENSDFNSLNFSQKILYNIPNLIYYTYIINYFLAILMIIGNYLITKNEIKNKPVRILLYIFELISIIPILVITFNNKFSSSNIFTIIYFILYSISSFYLIIKSSKNITTDLAIFFFFIGICSNGVMLLSPTWGYRTSFSTYLFMGISYLIIIDRYVRINKFLNYLIIICNIIGMLGYITFYISVHLQYMDNYEIINKGIETKSKNIVIVSYPAFAPCNINPTNEYHMKKFKEYYKIDKDTEVTLVDNNWKFHLLYRRQS